MIEDVCRQEKVEGVLITSSANMRKQSGFCGEGIVYISRAMRVVFTDSRYTIAAGKECPGFEIVEYKGSLYGSWIAYLIEHLGMTFVSQLCIGYEDSEMTVQRYQMLKQQLEQHGVSSMSLKPLADALDRLRQIKTQEEIQWIEKAEQIGDQAFKRITSKIQKCREKNIPLTEKQVAAYLEFYMKDAGAEGTSFDTIAASGIHSSMPHAIPTDKFLEEGDFLTMDFGCKVHGYCSDMTRTIVIGKADEKQKEIYEVVRQAQQAALDAIRPGMTGREVDEAARAIIRSAGYGDCFGHSLGHSVGLRIHETPCFSPGEKSEILPGMVITVEPGIYVEGFGGVRIEDVVVITEDGCRNLTHSEKKLIEIE